MFYRRLGDYPKTVCSLMFRLLTCVENSDYRSRAREWTSPSSLQSDAVLSGAQKNVADTPPCVTESRSPDASSPATAAIPCSRDGLSNSQNTVQNTSSAIELTQEVSFI